jgi:ABC-type multidrug transport system ATPase subunit
MFENHRYSQFAMIGINLFSGMILLVAAFTMTLVESTYKINDVLMYFYRLLPTFSFAHGLLQIANLEINQYLLNSVQRGGNPSNPVIYKPIDLQIAGTDVLYLAIECVAYSLLLVFLQNRYRVGVVNCSCNCLKACTSCRKPAVESEKADSANNGPEEDADVVQEASRIDGLVSSGDLNVKSENRLESGFAFDDAVILHNLRKVYPARNGKQKEKVAVKSLSLGIHRNECFGLLGINGAGKTTTLSILSGDFPPTSGEAFIDNCDVVSNLSQAQKRFGYCPQFDAIFDLLTAREHLQFYGRMKGVPENVLDVVVENKIQELGLSLHADKMAGGYSGGNKRKLSVAMATIGKPSVVFLDEPSTGMDPVSRRFMWDVISMIAERSSVILTTHSMEECEALCSRIGIMVDGGLRCLGTSQHLKNVYGSGYQLEINVKVPTSVNVEETLKKWNLNDNSTVTDNEVRHTIGDSLFEKCFSETGSANLLYQQLIHGKGSVEAKSLAEWYYVEMAQENIEKVLEEHFPGYGLLERQGVRFRYSLPAIDDLPLAKMFGIIETNRDICNIQGYSLGQTTLESVFNTFASKQDTTD